MPRNINVMGYPFLDGTQAVSSLQFLSSWFLLHLSIAYSNLFPFTFQPIIQEHKELVWLVGNLKLEVTQYLKDCTALGDWLIPAMMMMMMILVVVRTRR